MHGESHYRPWEILRLTEAEMIAALDDDMSERRPPTGSTPIYGPGDEIEYIRRLREMTPAERLQRAMED